MTAPESGSTRPGRVAGVALLGIAAVSLVIGLVTAFGGDGAADGAGEKRPPTPPAATTTSRPSSTSESKPPSSTSSSVRPTTTTTTTTTTSGGSGSTGQTPSVTGGDGNGEPAKSVPVRVYNNSTIRGLAKEAADDIRADGWTVTEVGNYPDGIIRTSTVYFRPGTDEEAAARAIGAAFGMRVEPRFEGIEDSAPGVIVIVTNNYRGVPTGGKNES
jgi:hypothetical protein